RAVAPAAPPRPARDARRPAPPPPSGDPRLGDPARALSRVAQRAALDRLAQGHLDPRLVARLRLRLDARRGDPRRARARRARAGSAARGRRAHGLALPGVHRPRRHGTRRAAPRGAHPRIRGHGIPALGDSGMSEVRPRGAPLTVTLVVVCQGFNMLTVGGIALFLPLIREDLGMSFAQAGLLSALSTFTYALGQIPAGVLAD